MNNNFQYIDLPRLKNSLIAAYLRTADGKMHGKEAFSKAVTMFANEMHNIMGLMRTRDNINLVRRAVNDLIQALDPCHCILFHCEHNQSQSAMNCAINKHPLRCGKVVKYNLKKTVVPACRQCNFIGGEYGGFKSSFRGRKCEVQRDADRPSYCPRLKK